MFLRMVTNGVLGGMISSTATTVTYARHTADRASMIRISAFIILTADAVSIIRVIIEMGVVVPQKLSALILPFITLFVFMAILSAVLFYLASNDKEIDEIPEPKNPAQFKSALMFGLLYALILLAVAWSQEKLGNKGLYLVSAVGGLVKKDAITLSLAQSIRNGMDTELGWRLIMTGLVSNMVFKSVLSLFLGSRVLAKWLSISVVLSAVLGTLLILFWPK